MPPRLPPAGSSFRIVDGIDEAVESAASNALLAIESVHDMAKFGPVPIRSTTALPEVIRGLYDPLSRRIWLNAKGKPTEMTAIHEIAHAIDHVSFGGGPSVAGIDPRFKLWRKAIRNTESHRTLRFVYTTESSGMLTKVPGESRLGTALDRAHAAYLLDWAEYWARSYAQFIIAETGIALLGDQLDATRDCAEGRLFQAQWTDEDFSGVRIEVRRVLESRGWM